MRIQKAIPMLYPGGIDLTATKISWWLSQESHGEILLPTVSSREGFAEWLTAKIPLTTVYGDLSVLWGIDMDFYEIYWGRRGKTALKFLLTGRLLERVSGVLISPGIVRRVLGLSSKTTKEKVHEQFFLLSGRKKTDFESQDLLDAAILQYVLSRIITEEGQQWPRSYVIT